LDTRVAMFEIHTWHCATKRLAYVATVGHQDSASHCFREAASACVPEALVVERQQ
jgi:hypothetical protein